jgi:ribonuclease Z
MNAEHVLLTHFSARYPNMPLSVTKPPKQDSDRERPTVGLAFDHANIRLGGFWKLNMYLPAIQQSFHEIAEDEDEKSRLQVEW